MKRLTFIVKENRFLNILSLLNYFFIVFQYLNRLSRNNKLLVKFMICLLLFRKYIPPWPLKSGQKYIIYFFDFKIHLLVLHFYPLLQMPILLKNIKKLFPCTGWISNHRSSPTSEAPKFLFFQYCLYPMNLPVKGKLIKKGGILSGFLHIFFPAVRGIHLGSNQTPWTSVPSISIADQR